MIIMVKLPGGVVDARDEQRHGSEPDAGPGLTRLLQLLIHRYTRFILPFEEYHVDPK